jgi:hypothetical protein
VPGELGFEGVVANVLELPGNGPEDVAPSFGNPGDVKFDDADAVNVGAADNGAADIGAAGIEAVDAAVGRPATGKLDSEDIGEGKPELDAGAGGKLGRPAEVPPLEFRPGTGSPILFPTLLPSGFPKLPPGMLRISR